MYFKCTHLFIYMLKRSIYCNYAFVEPHSGHIIHLFSITYFLFLKFYFLYSKKKEPPSSYQFTFIVTLPSIFPLSLPLHLPTTLNFTVTFSSSFSLLYILTLLFSILFCINLILFFPFNPYFSHKKIVSILSLSLLGDFCSSL